MSVGRANARRSVIVGYGRAGRGLHHRALRGLFGPDHPVLVVDPCAVTDPGPGVVWTPAIADAVRWLARAGEDPAEAVFHVTTCPSLHLPCVEELVRLGARRIIVEKPVADTLADAQLMGQLGSRATILPMSVWLASNVTSRVEAAIRAGAVGALRSLHMEQSKPRFRRTLESSAHTNAFQVELPHQLLLVLALAGPALELLSAHSWPMTLSGGTRPEMGGAILRLRHHHGVTSTLVTDLTSPVRRRRLLISGSVGEIVADYPVSGDDDFGQVRGFGQPRRELISDDPLTQFLARAYAFFAGAGPAPRGDLAMHLHAAELLDSAVGCSLTLPTELELTS